VALFLMLLQQPLYLDLRPLVGLLTFDRGIGIRTSKRCARPD
jgi:hypothetical protein